MNPLLAKRLSAALARHGWRVQRTVDGEPNPAHLWATDEKFQAAMQGPRSRSLVHDAACYVLYRSLQTTAGLDGDVAEVGVYRGGTALLIARAVERGTRVHLFDTFTGMPDADVTRDMHRAGDFADTSLEAVRSLFADNPDVVLHPGFFPDTAAPEGDRKFRLVHVDVDIHRSVLDCCEFFYPRLVPGGVLVFDDYGWTSTVGARDAVDDFFSGRYETPVYLPTGQALVLKR
ncbi:MAG: TylF/MycF/NovP-related O-methyltransferase [Sporichthyaceae bacterium]